MNTCKLYRAAPWTGRPFALATIAQSSCSRCILHIRSLGLGATQKFRRDWGTDVPDNIITNKGHVDIKINSRAAGEGERGRKERKRERRATRRDRARETCL